MLLKKGQPAKAISLFSQAKEINPGNREAYIWLVVYYKSAGEYSRARAVLREMLKKFTGDSWAQKRLSALEAGPLSDGGRQMEK
jgi:tetratricopeptide (TPR) repeat protein